MQERVVITGLGTINPSGNNISQYWKNLEAGKNSIKNISLFDTSDYKIKVAGECSVNLDDYFNSKEINKLDRFTAFSLIASNEAIIDSNLNNNFNPNRAGQVAVCCSNYDNGTRSGAMEVKSLTVSGTAVTKVNTYNVHTTDATYESTLWWDSSAADMFFIAYKGGGDHGFITPATINASG